MCRISDQTIRDIHGCVSEPHQRRAQLRSWLWQPISIRQECKVIAIQVTQFTTDSPQAQSGITDCSGNRNKVIRSGPGPHQRLAQVNLAKGCQRKGQ